MHLHICTIIYYDFVEVSAFYKELLVYHLLLHPQNSLHTINTM
jgi:hypothetical protein